MNSPSSDKLHFAAARGPITIIVLHNSPPSLILTTDDFVTARRTICGICYLAHERRASISNQYEDALSSVLKGLYELVGRPVIQRL